MEGIRLVRKDCPALPRRGSSGGFLQKRAEYEALATVEKPLSLNRQLALDAFESTKAVEWRKIINAMEFQCVYMLDYILKHIKVLSQHQPHQNITANIYMYS